MKKLFTFYISYYHRTLIMTREQQDI